MQIRLLLYRLCIDTHFLLIVWVDVYMLISIAFQKVIHLFLILLLLLFFLLSLFCCCLAAVGLGLARAFT